MGRRPLHCVAVDLGAETGRVMLCRWSGEQGEIKEGHRFSNKVYESEGHYFWNLEHLWQGILEGLARGALLCKGRIDSIGIDGWAADYVLLDQKGHRIHRTYSYRDPRNRPMMHWAFSKFPKSRIYKITGIQFLPFNTLYQLLAHIDKHPEHWERTRCWLNLPEYFLFRLSGQAISEYTNATSTQMVDALSRDWSAELTKAFELDLRRFPPIVPPGTVLGRLRQRLGRFLGLKGAKIVAPACQDAAAAVAGIPFPPQESVFISSGTWSLVGMVLPQPVLSREAFEANFTNEGGVGDSFRFFTNVPGLWLLQQCLEEWRAQGQSWKAAALAEACQEIEPEGPDFTLREDRFLAPDNMLERINASLLEAGFAEEKEPVRLAASIFRSLARRYPEVINELQSITGASLRRVCIVGDGVRNEPLNRLTDYFTGLQVLKGPPESATGGNLALQIAAVENTHRLSEILSIASRLCYPAET